MTDVNGLDDHLDDGIGEGVESTGDPADSTYMMWLQAVPELARLAASSWWSALRWVTSVTSENSRRIGRAVAAGVSPTQVVAEIGSDVRAAILDLLGLGAASVEPGGRPHSRSRSQSERGGTRRLPVTAAELQARGAELLHDAADVWYEADAHPAYARILDDLSPDEARILCLLSTDGAQPAIDVRTNRPLGVGSELVAGGLSMIGLQAGVRHVDRTRADLNNLYRLGLVWFSREEVEDPSRYQVVEVQPDVVEVLKAAGRSPKIVHRSIHLTPFGEDFCATCLPTPASPGRSPNGSSPPEKPSVVPDGGAAGTTDT